MMNSAAGCTSSRLSTVASATSVCRSCCGREGVLELLIDWIDLARDGISVTLHAAGIRSLVAEFADQERPALVASEPLLEAAE